MLYPDFNELLHIGERVGYLHLKSRHKTLAARVGDYVSPFRGQGLEFHEVREYRLGDDVRNIDWRVTARMGRPYLKIFTEDRERTVLLCIDANAAMRFGTRGTFKSIQIARAAALIGWMAQAAGDKVGATVFGDVPDGLQFFAPTHGRRVFWQTLKLLSRKMVEDDIRAIPLDDALVTVNRTAQTGALVFVISDFTQIGDQTEKNLANLRRRCDIILVRVNDPADRTLPPMDSTWFSDDFNAKQLISTFNDTGLKTYEKQWEENHHRLDGLAVRRRIGIIDIHTNKDVVADLTNGLSRIDLQRRSRR